MVDRKNATAGLFYTSLDPQQTKSHRRNNAATGEVGYSSGDPDFDRQAAREAYRSPPAAGVEIAFRHRSWISDRARVREAMAAAAVGSARLERFDNCGGDCIVEYHPEKKRHRLRANYCGDRWCNPCQKSRAKQLSVRLVEWIHKAPTRFLTLTIRGNKKSLSERRQHLLRSFSKLRRMKDFRSRVSGGAACLQITRGECGDHWHIHLHALVHGSFIKQKKLSALWEKATGDSWIVDIRAIPDPQKAADYVARYAAKGCERDVILDPGALVEAVVSLRGERMLITWGTWWGCRVERVVPDQSGWHRVGRLVQIYAACQRGEVWASGIFASLRVAVNAEGEDAIFTPLQFETRGPAPPS